MGLGPCKGPRAATSPGSGRGRCGQSSSSSLGSDGERGPEAGEGGLAWEDTGRGELLSDASGQVKSLAPLRSGQSFPGRAAAGESSGMRKAVCTPLVKLVSHFFLPGRGWSVQGTSPHAPLFSSEEAPSFLRLKLDCRALEDPPEGLRWLGKEAETVLLQGRYAEGPSPRSPQGLSAR